MKVELDRLVVNKPTANQYPLLKFTLSREDTIDGFILEITAKSLVAGTIDAEIVAGFGDEVAATEIAGTTIYDVNAGAAASHHLGKIVLDFSEKLTNRVSIKPGTVVGTCTFPAVMSPGMQIVIKSATLDIGSARVTRRLGTER